MPPRRKKKVIARKLRSKEVPSETASKSQRSEEVRKLIGKKVIVILDTNPLSDNAKPIEGTLQYVGTKWLGIRYTYRGNYHTKHMPIEKVLFVDDVKPMKPR